MDEILMIYEIENMQDIHKILGISYNDNDLVIKNFEYKDKYSFKMSIRINNKDAYYIRIDDDLQSKCCKYLVFIMKILYKMNSNPFEILDKLNNKFNYFKRISKYISNGEVINIIENGEIEFYNENNFKYFLSSMSIYLDLESFKKFYRFNENFDKKFLDSYEEDVFESDDDEDF